MRSHCSHGVAAMLMKYAHNYLMLFLYPRPTKLVGGILDSPCPSVCLSVCPSVCRRHGFRSVTQVCFGISIPNVICTLFVGMGRSLLIFSDVTFKMAAWRPYWIFRFPDSNFNLPLNIKSKLHWHITCVYRKKSIDFQRCHFQYGCLAAIFDFSVSGLYSWHGSWSVTLDCFGISISNFICVLFVAMGKSLLIFSWSCSKWPPDSHIGFFSFRILTLVWHWISSPNFSSKLLVCMERNMLIFSNVTFKMAAWRPYWIFQFQDSNFSLALNIKSKLQ